LTTIAIPKSILHYKY